MTEKKRYPLGIYFGFISLAVSVLFFLNFVNSLYTATLENSLVWEISNVAQWFGFSIFTLICGFSPEKFCLKKEIIAIPALTCAIRAFICVIDPVIDFASSTLISMLHGVTFSAFCICFIMVLADIMTGGVKKRVKAFLLISLVFLLAFVVINFFYSYSILAQDAFTSVVYALMQGTVEILSVVSLYIYADKFLDDKPAAPMNF